MATPYSRGVRKEWQTVKTLKEMGYEVTRSAGSLGLWDVVGVSPYEVLLVQVKYGEKVASDKNLKRLRELQVPDNVRKQMWVYHYNTGKPEVIDLGG